MKPETRGRKSKGYATKGKAITHDIVSYMLLVPYKATEVVNKVLESITEEEITAHQAGTPKQRRAKSVKADTEIYPLTARAKANLEALPSGKRSIIFREKLLSIPPQELEKFRRPGLKIKQFRALVRRVKKTSKKPDPIETLIWMAEQSDDHCIAAAARLARRAF